MEGIRDQLTKDIILLLYILEKYGTWCDSNVIKLGTSWHLSIEEYTKYESVIERIKKQLEVH